MNSPPLDSPSTQVADESTRLPFDEHVQQAMGALRVALRDLLKSVEADPKTPQKVSRRFNINRNLSWKISRLISEEDVHASVRHVPGTQGVRILCERFRDAGAPDDVVQAVGDAMVGFQRMVKVQAGDRTALDLTLRSLRPEGDGPDGVLAARKLAFQGNSAVWGVRAGIKLAIQVVAPGSEAGQVDIATVSGLVDFWRLRADARWPLIHYRCFADGDVPKEQSIEPIEDLGDGQDGPPWLPAFCSAPLPDCRKRTDVEGLMYEIMEGPVGNTAALTCVYGRIVRNAASFTSDVPGQTGEHQVQMNTPVELAHFDLLVHKSLHLPESPQLLVESRLQVAGALRSIGEPIYSLKVLEQVETVNGGLDAMEDTAVPNHRDMLVRATGTLGYSADDFTCYRVTMRYPPVPSVLKLIHPLQTKA